MSHVTKVVVFGGSGHLGSHIVKHLLASPHRFEISVATRSESTTPYDQRIKVHTGDYEDVHYLELATANEDVVIICLAFWAHPDVQSKIITAAIKNDVKYIIPQEFGNLNSDPAIEASHPINANKRRYREEIEAQGGQWFAIANGFWADYVSERSDTQVAAPRLTQYASPSFQSLERGYFAIDIKQRTARVWSGGDDRISTTNLSDVGLAVARLLALPLERLAAYGNRFVRIYTFVFSQNDILTAAQEATNTDAADWKITHETYQEVITRSKKILESGHVDSAVVDWHFAVGFQMKSDLSVESENELLGLKAGTHQHLVALCKAIEEAADPEDLNRDCNMSGDHLK